MAAASPPPSFHRPWRLPSTQNTRATFARASSRSFNEEEDKKWCSRSTVDANMGALRARTEVAKVRERLQRRWDRVEGWYYDSYTPLMGYDEKAKREKMVAESLALVEVAAATFVLTIVGCTACLICFCLLLHHLPQPFT